MNTFDGERFRLDWAKLWAWLIALALVAGVWVLVALAAGGDI